MTDASALTRNLLSKLDLVKPAVAANPTSEQNSAIVNKLNAVILKALAPAEEKKHVALKDEASSVLFKAFSKKNTDNINKKSDNATISTGSCHSDDDESLEPSSRSKSEHRRLRHQAQCDSDSDFSYDSDSSYGSDDSSSQDYDDYHDFYDEEEDEVPCYDWEAHRRNLARQVKSGMASPRRERSPKREQSPKRQSKQHRQLRSQSMGTKPEGRTVDWKNRKSGRDGSEFDRENAGADMADGGRKRHKSPAGGVKPSSKSCRKYNEKDDHDYRFTTPVGPDEGKSMSRHIHQARSKDDNDKDESPGKHHALRRARTGTDMGNSRRGTNMRNSPRSTLNVQAFEGGEDKGKADVRKNKQRASTRMALERERTAARTEKVEKASVALDEEDDLTESADEEEDTRAMAAPGMANLQTENRRAQMGGFHQDSSCSVSSTASGRGRSSRGRRTTMGNMKFQDQMARNLKNYEAPELGIGLVAPPSTISSDGNAAWKKKLERSSATTESIDRPRKIFPINHRRMSASHVPDRAPEPLNNDNDVVGFEANFDDVPW